MSLVPGSEAVKLRFWLLAMDLLPFGSRPYFFALRRASDCVDWGEIPAGCECGKEPW